MRRIARLTCLALAAAGAAVPATRAAAQEDVHVIAILPFNAQVVAKDARDYEGLHKAIADFLAAELSANPGVRVVERGQVQRAADAQRPPSTAWVSRETASKAGRSVGAQKVVFGSFAPDARGNLRIDARVVDVASGAVDFTDRVQDRADNVGPLVNRLAAHIAGSLGLPPTTRTGDAGAQLPLRSAIVYGQALDMADRGERARAAELYNAVLKDYPSYEPAKRGLARLKPAP